MMRASHAQYVTGPIDQSRWEQVQMKLVGALPGAGPCQRSACSDYYLPLFITFPPGAITMQMIS